MAKIVDFVKGVIGRSSRPPSEYGEAEKLKIPVDVLVQAEYSSETDKKGPDGKYTFELPDEQMPSDWTAYYGTPILLSQKAHLKGIPKTNRIMKLLTRQPRSDHGMFKDKDGNPVPSWMVHKPKPKKKTQIQMGEIFGSTENLLNRLQGKVLSQICLGKSFLTVLMMLLMMLCLLKKNINTIHHYINNLNPLFFNRIRFKSKIIC